MLNPYSTLDHSATNKTELIYFPNTCTIDYFNHCEVFWPPPHTSCCSLLWEEIPAVVLPSHNLTITTTTNVCRLMLWVLSNHFTSAVPYRGRFICCQMFIVLTLNHTCYLTVTTGVNIWPNMYGGSFVLTSLIEGCCFESTLWILAYLLWLQYGLGLLKSLVDTSFDRSLIKQNFQHMLIPVSPKAGFAALLCFISSKIDYLWGFGLFDSYDNS